MNYYETQINRSVKSIALNLNSSNAETVMRLVTTYESIEWDVYEVPYSHIFYIRDIEEIEPFEKDLTALKIDFDIIKSGSTEETNTRESNFIDHLVSNAGWYFDDFNAAKKEITPILEYVNKKFKTFEEFMNSKLIDKIKSIVLMEELVSLNWIYRENESFNEVYQTYKNTQKSEKQ